jgi:hypothetical protein
MKLARSGPITEDSIRQFEEGNKDVPKILLALIGKAKKICRTGKKAGPTVNVEASKPVVDKLDELDGNDQLAEPVKELLAKLRGMIEGDKNTKDTLVGLEREIKDFAAKSKLPTVSTESEPAAESN